MKKSRAVYLTFLISLLAIGCSRGKDLEKLNREQAQAITGLNQQVASLQQEVDQLKAAKQDSGTRPQLAVTGGQQKSSYIK